MKKKVKELDGIQETIHNVKNRMAEEITKDMKAQKPVHLEAIKSSSLEERGLDKPEKK